MNTDMELRQLPLPSPSIIVLLDVARASLLTPTTALSGYQAKITGRVMKSSSEYGKYVTAARYIGFGVNELTEENGQTVSRTFQGFPIVNTEQTFPIEFSLDIDSQRECPKRATIYVPGNDTQGLFSSRSFPAKAS